MAAIIALAAVSNRMGMKVNGPQNQGGSSAGFLTPDDAFDEYLRMGQESGDVVGEVPTRVIVSSEKNSSGQGYDVGPLKSGPASGVGEFFGREKLLDRMLQVGVRSPRS